MKKHTKSRKLVHLFHFVGDLLADHRARRRLGIASAVFGGIAVLAGGAWGIHTLFAHRALGIAEAHLKNGYGSLASEALEPYRATLSRSEKGCQALVNANFQARRTERLEWAAQACLNGGIQTSDTYIGLAAVREITGRDAEAMQILTGVLAKFDKSPDVFYRIGHIMRRNKKDEEATAAFLKAAERAPGNAQLALELLEYFSSTNRWADAKRMAERLKDVETDNPEIRLVAARAFVKSGDAASAQTLVSKARELMEKKPESKAAIEQAYADVFSGAGQKPAAVPPPPPGSNVAQQQPPAGVPPTVGVDPARGIASQIPPGAGIPAAPGVPGPGPAGAATEQQRLPGPGGQARTF